MAREVHTAADMRLAAILVLTTVGCLVDPPTPKESSTSQELNGLEGMFEYAIDLPWRIEPRVQADGLRLYDPIPITIAIHDEDENPYSVTCGNPGDIGLPSPCPESLQHGGRLWEFCGLTVGEMDRDGTISRTVRFEPRELAWIDRTGRRFDAPAGDPQPTYWPHSSENLPPPTHAVCHPATEDCTAFERIKDTSEWHALAKWDAGVRLPGTSETVELIAYVSPKHGGCASPIALKNYARISWAYDPLPRFDDDRWLYGDLHYHSQSTDNEGESGYSYRAVVEAMGAIGLDFTFATDHASDSVQVVDIDRLEDGLLTERRRGLRDLSQPRWDSALEILHGAGGANDEVRAWWPAARPRRPSLFLGAEVDSTPEVGIAPTTLFDGPAWHLSYGDGRSLDLFDWTTDGFHTFGSQPSLTVTDLPDVFRAFVDVNNLTAYMLADTQGFNARHVGRQHVLYLPRTANVTNGLVASRTGVYGGATRHLLEGAGLLPEILAKQGIAFLAHPIANGGEGEGPGMVPYSDYQLAKVFGQQAWTGLQLWNEDARVASNGCWCGGIVACACPGWGDYQVTGYDFLGVTSSGSPMPGWNDGEYKFAPMYDVPTWSWQHTRFAVEQQLHNGAYLWDRMLRWGLDLGRTSQVPWVPAGDPRRMFMAGGSDAHGDFNYRREGAAKQPGAVTDDALGRVRNLVFAGPPRPCKEGTKGCPPGTPPTHTQDQVADALGQGKFAVTDGPAVRIVVDRNRNGAIDEADYPMGSVVELYNGEQLPLIVEWQTNGEFGVVDRVDLYVGVDTDSLCSGEGCLAGVNEARARTYAPPDHGVRRGPNESEERYQEGSPHVYPTDPPATACAGNCRMEDGYWLPLEGPARDKLRFTPTGPAAIHGTYRVTLNLDDYPMTPVVASSVQRAYVRAFVRTKKPCSPTSLQTPDPVLFSGVCSPRYGFTNPVWALRKTWTVGTECVITDRGLDRDLDGLPDLCDGNPDLPANLGWSRVYGGGDLDTTTAVAFDGVGNVYIAGSVVGTGRIERTPPATQPVTGPGTDGLIVRYDAAGTYLGHLQATGTGWATFTDVAIDDNGFLYASGYASGELRLGGFTLSSADSDPFVAKIRASDFAVQWVIRLGGTGYGRASAIAVMPDGRSAVIGDFTQTLTTAAGSFVAEGGADCYVLYLSTSGAQIGFQRLVGSGTCSAADIALDSTGAATFALNYQGTQRFGFTTRTTVGNNALVGRFGTAAEVYIPKWVRWLGDGSVGSYAQVAALATTPGGGVRMAGAFQGALTYAVGDAPFSTVGTSAGGIDGFTLGVAADGSVEVPSLWRIGGVDTQRLTGVAVSATGEVLLTGWFASAYVTTPAGTLPRHGSSDGLFVLEDPAGTPVWQRSYGGVNGTAGKAVAFSRDRKNLAIGSTLSGSAQIDDRRTLSSWGNSDGAVSVFRNPSVP